jgi:hypothetical protein
MTGGKRGVMRRRVRSPSTVLCAPTTYAVTVPLLPRVVIPVAVGLAGTACVLSLTGCASFNKALGQQQALIYFQSNTPVDFKMKVRTACDGLPHVKAVPIAKGVPLSSAIDVVAYNTTGAGVADIARLEECVNKFSPQVEGVDVTDSSDDS